MRNLIADIELDPLEGFGKLGTPGEEGVSIFSNFISSTIGLMTIIAIIWFVFSFFTGAIGIITAGSDKGALESSRKKIMTGVIGLVVTIAAIFVIRLLGILIGIENILNIESLFNQINLNNK